VQVVKKYSKAYSSRDQRGADVFVTSVARGSKKTLSKTFSSTFSTSLTLISGSDKATSSDVGLNASATVSYTTSIEWSGPPASSSFNTRYFYITPLYNSGTWKRVTTVTYIGTSQKPTVTTDTGGFKEVSKILNGQWINPFRMAGE
jgi:hypothetical protein